MSMGFNSNVGVGDAVYHVQTEDRGLNHPFVDTVVLSGGRVVYRRSVGYQDLLSAAALDEAVLGARIEQQHREVLEGVRAGSLPLERPQPAAIAVRLCNPTSWLVAGQASLEVEVLSRPERRPVAAADVQVAIEGAAEGETSQFASQTEADGRARLRFRMPPLADHPNPALIIRVRGAGAEEQLRYRLKPKPPGPAPAAR
jgi:hypothetical protein